MTDDRFEELVVKVTDEVASPLERAELMRFLSAHPERRSELDEHLGLKAITDDWVARVQLDAVEDRFREAPLTRAENTVGTALFAAGLALLCGYGTWELLAAPDVPLAVRVGTALLTAGTAVLGVSVIRWKLRTRPHDRYTEVIR